MADGQCEPSGPAETHAASKSPRIEPSSGDAVSAAAHLDGILDAYNRRSKTGNVYALDNSQSQDGISDANNTPLPEQAGEPKEPLHKEAGIDDAHTQPPTLLSVGVPVMTRVAVLLCQPAPAGANNANAMDVLCFRDDDGALSIVEHEGQEAEQHEDIACRIIDSLVAKPRSLRAAIRDRRQSSCCKRSLPMSRYSAFATMLTSLPVQRHGGEWVWVPIEHVENHVAEPVMQRVVLDALAALTRSKCHPEQSVRKTNDCKARLQLGSASLSHPNKRTQLGSNRRRRRDATARVARQATKRCTSRQQPAWHLPAMLESQELPAQLGRGKIKDGCHAVRSQVTVTPLHLRPFSLPSEISLWHQKIDSSSAATPPAVPRFPFTQRH